MAFVEGARHRPLVLPRRRRSTPARARRRASPVAVVLAGILTAFLLGLLYLTQTIHVAARTYEVDRLVAERERLLRQLQSLEGEVVRWGAEPAIVERAQQAGLDRLGSRLRVPSR